LLDSISRVKEGVTVENYKSTSEDLMLLGSSEHDLHHALGWFSGVRLSRD